MLDELEPKVEEVKVLAEQVRAANDAALLVLAGEGIDVGEGLLTFVDDRTGWGPLWNRLARLFGDESFDTTLLTNKQLSGRCRPWATGFGVGGPGQNLGVEWTAATLCDPSLAGYEGAFYVGLVVRYDVPEGWQGFIHGRPIDGGPWADHFAACRAVERAWSGRGLRSPAQATWLGVAYARR